MSSTGTQTTNQSRYGSVLRAKRHTASSCSNESSYRVEDLGSSLLRRSIVRLDLPLPRHRMGYCQAELATFVKAGPLKQFHKWMYGQTVGVENNEHIYYTYDVVRWVEAKVYGTKPIWD